MKKTRTALLLIMMFLLIARSQQAARPHVLVINHVTVIDATGAPPASDMAIVIIGERIAGISNARETTLPADAQVVDADGRFIIPGLWDMHVHTLTEPRVESFFPVFIAYGILGVRDMGSPPAELETINQWKKDLAAGERLGPRIVAAGPLVDGPQPMFPDLSIAVADEIEARQVVAMLKERGADFIKVYSLLPGDAYFAIADEARRQKIVFAGHVPDAVSAAEASDAGQQSIEHLSSILLACSTREAELRSELLEARAGSDPALLWRALRDIHTIGKPSYSPEKAATLFARFVQNNTWQVPTLTVAWADASFSNQEINAGLRYAPSPSQSTNEAVLNEGRGITDATAIYSTWASERDSEAFNLVGAMHHAGVKMMAGTDAPNPWAYPGISLHQELVLLVRAGLTSLEALQAATTNPATYLGLQDSLGTVEKGKTADLVLLEANPLEDIGNTRRIAGVVFRGRWIEKSELREKPSKIEGSVDSP